MTQKFKRWDTEVYCESDPFNADCVYVHEYVTEDGKWILAKEVDACVAELEERQRIALDNEKYAQEHYLEMAKELKEANERIAELEEAQKELIKIIDEATEEESDVPNS